MRLQPGLIVACAVAILAAGTARAQPATSEPWRGPADAPKVQPAENRAHVTSSQAATDPSEAEQKEARALAAAVFAKPAAGQRAADNNAPKPGPDLGAVQPRAEWTDKVVPGGAGLKVTQPF